MMLHPKKCPDKTKGRRCSSGEVANVRGARPAGLEPTTLGLEGRCSIQLSYGRIAVSGIIPKFDGDTTKTLRSFSRGNFSPPLPPVSVPGCCYGEGRPLNANFKIPLAPGLLDDGALLDRFLESIERRNLLRSIPRRKRRSLSCSKARTSSSIRRPARANRSSPPRCISRRSRRDERSVYTCPIKALVNEKWLALCREFGPENVGLSTGDASVNRDAPILCCTAEILANIALREGAERDVRRCHHGRISLLRRSRARRGLAGAAADAAAGAVSADVGDAGRHGVLRGGTDPAQWAAERSRCRRRIGRCRWSLPTRRRRWPRRSRRSSPKAKAPVYVVHFTQLEAAQSAQDFTSINVCTREEKAAIAQRAGRLQVHQPVRAGDQEMAAARHRPASRRVCCRSIACWSSNSRRQGLLKIICGTDTLGVGINVPIRTVLFTQLCKYDGQKTGILSARDFHQIGGRAGRKGFDDRRLGGRAGAGARDRESEARAEEAARRKEIRETQAAREEFRELGQEDLRAPDQRAARSGSRRQFQVTHGMLLNVLSRPTRWLPRDAAI